MNTKKVFISYSHDSDEHRERVLSLSERLRQDGIDAFLDQYLNGTPKQGWPRWMLDQIDAADFVLVICTETYYTRFRGHEKPGYGKGVDWEGALITQEIYDSHSQSLKFVPTFLSETTEAWIPDPLRKVSYYTVTSEANYKRLYDFLLDQGGVEPRILGASNIKPRRQGSAITFPDPVSPEAAQIDISRIVKYAPTELIGREIELALLNDAWAKTRNQELKRPHILTFVALGGEGKTSLVAKWAAEMAHEGWMGFDAVFAWTFYSQGIRPQTMASSDSFLKEALIFFGDEPMANSAAVAYDKGKRLAQLIARRRALLILDGLEPLQYSPISPIPGELKDPGVSALLKGLAATSNGLCIVTTRYSISDLRVYHQTNAPEMELMRLSKKAGVHLLQTLGVKGTVNEFEILVEDVSGHALTLNLLGSYLNDAHEGDIRRRDLVMLEEADNEEQGGHAFRVMDAYVKSLETGGKTDADNVKGRRALAILRLLGLFDRPASADCFAALLKAPAIPNLTELLIQKKEAPRRLAISRLEASKLVTVNRDAIGRIQSLEAHPLLREYFAKNLQERNPSAWCTAHRRLYKHLCASASEGLQPTLESLQPLYQAIGHGCQAGLLQEAFKKVYFTRILRESEFYSMKKLGAFASDLGVVAYFFEIQWTLVSQTFAATDQAWLLNTSAFCLRALGRLTEALDPLRAGLEMGINQNNWRASARRAGNLSELELMLGNVAGAVADAEQSVTYADRSSDWNMRVILRATHANVLHQAGRLTEAQVRFREAEQIQTAHQSNDMPMYSIQGFWYCDLLLTETEREAWKKVGGGKHKAELLAVCRAVAERAQQTLSWVEQNDMGIVDIALNHLSLGRATFFNTILENPCVRLQASDILHIERAVAGLRRAGMQDYLPYGLLTRAWLRSLTDRLTGPESAQSDLDEAWGIAERGPMPLHMADIHLYRARLFFREARYPWDNLQADLAKARRLIEKHGYWRRKEELENAEKLFSHEGQTGNEPI